MYQIYFLQIKGILYIPLLQGFPELKINGKNFYQSFTVTSCDFIIVINLLTWKGCLLC